MEHGAVAFPALRTVAKGAQVIQFTRLEVHAGKCRLRQGGRRIQLHTGSGDARGFIRLAEVQILEGEIVIG